MHTLAMKADQGRNPDQLIVGLYNPATPNSPEYLMGITEPQSMPVAIDGLLFPVPSQDSVLLDPTEE
jgi:hypothetical protein